jgi:hypothetical protein
MRVGLPSPRSVWRTSGLPDSRFVQRHSWLPVTSEHSRARLGRLFHESQGLPPSGKLLVRPTYQWRYGYNHQTVYRRAAGTSRFLCAAGIHDERTLRWVNKTWGVPVSDASDQEPSVHDAGLSFIASSIEIGVRRANALKFLTHLDILGHGRRGAIGKSCARVTAPEGPIVFRDLYASEADLSDLPQSSGPAHSLHLLRSGSDGERYAACRAARPRNQISFCSRRFRLSIRSSAQRRRRSCSPGHGDGWTDRSA